MKHRGRADALSDRAREPDVLVAAAVWSTDLTDRDCEWLGRGYRVVERSSNSVSYGNAPSASTRWTSLRSGRARRSTTDPALYKTKRAGKDRVESYG